MKLIAIAVQSLDGLTARNHHDLVNWSSPEDKKLFAQETKESGVIIMGRNTFELFPHPLKDRLNLVLTSHPEKFTSIPDSLEFMNESPEVVLKTLEERGFISAFVIGGQRVYSEFIKLKLVDEVWITIEPIIFSHGLTLFSEVPEGTSFELLKVEKLNESSVHLRYKINYSG